MPFITMGSATQESCAAPRTMKIGSIRCSLQGCHRRKEADAEPMSIRTTKHRLAADPRRGIDRLWIRVEQLLAPGTRRHFRDAPSRLLLRRSDPAGRRAHLQSRLL